MSDDPDDTMPGFPPRGSYAERQARSYAELKARQARATMIPPPAKPPMGPGKKTGIVAILVAAITCLSQVPWDQVLAFITHFGQ